MIIPQIQQFHSTIHVALAATNFKLLLIVRHYNYFSIYSFVRYILYFVVSQASSTGRHGSTDCTVPGAASLADYKVKYISHK